MQFFNAAFEQRRDTISFSCFQFNLLEQTGGED